MDIHHSSSETVHEFGPETGHVGWCGGVAECVEFVEGLPGGEHVGVGIGGEGGDVGVVYVVEDCEALVFFCVSLVLCSIVEDM